MNKKLQILNIFMLFLVALAANVFGQSGGIFEIKQSVIAGGGQNSAGGTFTLNGTFGQAAAGNAQRNPPFALTSGFWNFTAAAPTAAQVSIGGRVRTSSGNGIRNVRVTLTLPNGETRNVSTGGFGYFQFEGVTVGETYVISVAAKKYTFGQPTIVRTVFEAIADLDFVSDFE